MKRRTRKTLNDYPPHLRGYANNKFGGHQATRLRSYNSDWSKRYPCYSYSEEEKRVLEEQYRNNGFLSATMAVEDSGSGESELENGAPPF